MLVRVLQNFRCLLCVLFIALPLAGAHAQAWPSRPIRLVVPYGSGGPTDVLARALAQGLQEQLKQAVIVDNKPGAGGIIGVENVAKSPADGYTLLFTASGTMVINPSLYPKLPYQAKDFAPVSSAASYAMFLSVNPGLSFSTLGDLIAYAKRHPGKLSYGSAGNGTSNHLAGALLAKMAGIELTHVPYKGNAPAMTDVIAGNIAMMFDLPSTTLPQAQSGKVALLGTTGRERSELAPQVPTIVESGVPGYDVTSWFGVFAPAKTPPAIVNRLSELITQVLKDPAISARLSGQGYKVFGSTPAQLADMTAADTRMWSGLIREAHIQVD
ncbi:MAG: tripartite tricarboxylate transporter substrate binding protein [Burkholderiaceae bacterium]|nr:MAG: tripartite tricarboxylate transporter substrate binding protein [Burkholderiaceae bacterium]